MMDPWIDPGGVPFGTYAVLTERGRTVQCHVCGVWRVMLANHLRVHDLSGAAYRARFGFRPDYGLVAKCVGDEIARRCVLHPIPTTNPLRVFACAVCHRTVQTRSPTVTICGRVACKHALLVSMQIDRNQQPEIAAKNRAAKRGQRRVQSEAEKAKRRVFRHSAAAKAKAAAARAQWWVALKADPDRYRTYVARVSQGRLAWASRHKEESR